MRDDSANTVCLYPYTASEGKLRPIQSSRGHAKPVEEMEVNDLLSAAGLAQARGAWSAESAQKLSQGFEVSALPRGGRSSSPKKCSQETFQKQSRRTVEEPAAQC